MERQPDRTARQRALELGGTAGERTVKIGLADETSGVGKHEPAPFRLRDLTPLPHLLEDSVFFDRLACLCPKQKKGSSDNEKESSLVERRDRPYTIV